MEQSMGPSSCLTFAVHRSAMSTMEAVTSSLGGLSLDSSSSNSSSSSSSSSTPSSPQQYKTIVIVGGTGNQGGAAIKHLQEPRGIKWKIICISRDPSQAAAKALVSQGVVVEKGDANIRSSLDAVMQRHAPVHAMFAITNPFTARWTGGTGAKTDVVAEEKQGCNMIDACKALGPSFEHFVYSSVASAGDSVVDGKGIPSFEAKDKIEKYLEKSGVPYTILAPVGFFENMTSSFAGIKAGVIPGLLKPSSTLTQMISIRDIGWFTRMVLEDRPTWLGRRLEIAGDSSSIDDKAIILSRLRGGEPFKVSTPPDFVFYLFIPSAISRLKQFLEKKGCHADIAECRRLHPKLMDFEAWCKLEGLDKKKLDAPNMCTIS